VTAIPAMEISETDARGSVADGYAEIRRCLRSSFVPTIYRRLALHPDAFAVAVAGLPAVVRTGDESHFVEAAWTVARDALPEPHDDDRVALSILTRTDGVGVADVLDRYRRANPLNLLFSLSIVGLLDAPQPGVMGPPLPDLTADGIWADIAACHHSAFVPGVWREMAAAPAVLETLWARMRALAASGAIVPAREAVRRLALSVAADSPIQGISDEIRSALPVESASAFRWFPTGVATMIAEVEWLTWDVSVAQQGSTDSSPQPNKRRINRDHI
jgi:hypothetical protein